MSSVGESSSDRPDVCERLMRRNQIGELIFVNATVGGFNRAGHAAAFADGMEDTDSGTAGPEWRTSLAVIE